MQVAAEDINREYGPFDVLHGHDWLVSQVAQSLKARLQVPLVVTIHSTEVGRNLGVLAEPMKDLKQAIHFEECVLASVADRVITISQFMRREVQRLFGVDAVQIYSGTTTATAVERAEPSFSSEAPYFVFVGRLVREKGLQVAIEALSRMRHRVHLVVCGEGPMRPILSLLCGKWKVADRVHFLGRVSSSQRDALLRKSVAGLVPSLYEPFGLVALEIMAAEMPVVLSDTGGLSEIVAHGADGLKFPPGDARALAGLMDSLLEDPAIAAELGQAGSKTVGERFAWNSIVSKTVEIYRSLMR
jgi:1,4-alpha-glucan branching enzyme